MSPATYLLHGLRVRSELPLDAVAEPGDLGRSVDLTVALGPPRRVHDRVPGSDELAAVWAGGRTISTLCAAGAGFTFRSPGLLEAEIDPSLSRIEVGPDPCGDNRLLPLIVAGGAMACVLTLAGRLVLHASAVEIGGRAVAFLGASGSGKSVLAAAACAAGARHLADDVLRVETRGDRTWCFAGSRSIRLRPGAASLAQRLDGACAPWLSADGRTCVVPRASSELRPELHAAVVARRTTGPVGLKRLAGGAATVAMLSNPRLAGLSDGHLARSHLSRCAAASRAVPVFEVDLPWTSDPVERASALLAELGLPV